MKTKKQKLLLIIALISLFGNHSVCQSSLQNVFLSTQLQEGMLLKWDKLSRGYESGELQTEHLSVIEITVIQDVPADLPVNWSNYDEFFIMKYDGVETVINGYLNDYIFPVLYEEDGIIYTLIERYPETNELERVIEHTKHTIKIAYTGGCGPFTSKNEYEVDIETGIVKERVYTENYDNTTGVSHFVFKSGIVLAGYNLESLGFIITSLLFAFVIIYKKKRKTNIPKN